MIADSHAHLDMPQFDSDRDDVIRRARDGGVDLLITIGTANPAESSIEKTLDLAAKHDFILAGIGVHPHDSRLPDEPYWEQMDQWARHEKVVLWGEIGLDYHYDHSPRETQRLVFRRQLRMAREHNLPVSIHCRDAWPDLVAILREEWDATTQRGILHSFTGDREQARECAAMGFLISFSGIVTFKKADSLREAARCLSLDQILVETDSPFLAPVPHRGIRNEPAFVVDVARSLAQTLGVTFDEVARHTSRNLRRLIQLTIED